MWSRIEIRFRPFVLTSMLPKQNLYGWAIAANGENERWGHICWIPLFCFRSMAWHCIIRILCGSEDVVCARTTTNNCPECRSVHPPKSMMHIAYSPYFLKNYKFPFFRKNYKITLLLFNWRFLLHSRLLLSPFWLCIYDAFMHNALHVLDA